MSASTNTTSNQVSTGKTTKLIRRMLIGAALVLLVGHLLVYVGYAISLAQFPFDYDQGEGFELNDTVLLSQGQSPYRDNAVYPFYASNYPPLYHVFLVPFVWLFGPQYWYGRLFGFAASLITAAAIAYAVQRATRQRLIAIIAGLCYIASNYIYHIGPLFRQHITMVMFETLAIVALAIAVPALSGDPTQPAKLNRRALIVGLVCLLLAGFTKQLAIVTAGAFFAYLFLRYPRRAIGYGLVLGVFAGGLFLLINVITGGQWWLNIIAANVNGYIASQFIGLARQFFGLHGALFVLACLYALYELYFARLSVYTVWFAFAALGSALSGKWGAGDSYFSTLIAAMCVLAGLFLARAWSNSWTFADNYLSRGLKRLNVKQISAVVAPIGALLFVMYGLAVIHIPLDGPIFGTIAAVFNIHSNTKFANFYDSAGWTQGYATIGQRPSASDAANGWQIVDALKADPRPALSEEAAFEFRAGKPVISNPTQLLNVYNNGLSDPAALVKMINEQAFGVVVFRARFYPQPVLDAVDAHYQLDATVPMNGYEYQILVPRSANATGATK
jgi:branched-subunit amino acid transport protein